MSENTTRPKFGLIVKFPDPENPAGIITAQFATIRGCPDMAKKLKACAAADVRECVAGKKLQVALDALQSADDLAAIDRAAETLATAQDERYSASAALIDAIRDFLVTGFREAGFSEARAEELADLVAPESLDEIKAKCQYGAGVLDFTKTPGQAS